MVDSSSLNRCVRLGQLRRRLPRGEGALQEIDPFVEFLELLPELMNSTVVSDGGPTPPLDSPRERRGDRTQHPDDHPAGGDKATEVNDREFVHGCIPL